MVDIHKIRSRNTRRYQEEGVDNACSVSVPYNQYAELLAIKKQYEGLMKCDNALSTLYKLGDYYPDRKDYILKNLYIHVNPLNHGISVQFDMTPDDKVIK